MSSSSKINPPYGVQTLVVVLADDFAETSNGASESAYREAA